MTRMMNGRRRVLFVCVENAGRSQIAEAFARKNGLVAESAGTHPAETLNPTVVQVMKEIGIDLSASRPTLLTQRMVEQASLIVTMGCSIEEACPRSMVEKMRKKLVDWALEDPKGKSIGEVRKIKAEIERKVTRLSRIKEKQGTTAQLLGTKGVIV